MEEVRSKFEEGERTHYVLVESRRREKEKGESFGCRLCWKSVLCRFGQPFRLCGRNEGGQWHSPDNSQDYRSQDYRLNLIFIMNW